MLESVLAEEGRALCSSAFWCYDKMPEVQTHRFRGLHPRLLGIWLWACGEQDVVTGGCVVEHTAHFMVLEAEEGRSSMVGTTGV